MPVTDEIFAASGRPRNTAFHTPNLQTFAALDLGTNNCRMMIGQNDAGRLRIIDSYSRIVRLGEGVSRTGQLSEAAMARTMKALSECAERLSLYNLTDYHFIATEACRKASNSEEFLREVKARTGMKLTIINQRDEAVLAFLGCAPLLSSEADYVLMLDIGGGSTEIILVDMRNMLSPNIVGWQSLPVGVMNVSERHGQPINEAQYQALVDELHAEFNQFVKSVKLDTIRKQYQLQMICCSGTVTTIAALHQDLPRYERREVDGFHLRHAHILHVIQSLLGSTHEERASHPCIGEERADYLVPGCSILQGACEAAGVDEITVADRGIREGILHSLLQKHMR